MNREDILKGMQELVLDLEKFNVEKDGINGETEKKAIDKINGKISNLDNEIANIKETCLEIIYERKAKREKIYEAYKDAFK